jgi:hypothetical protein
MKDIVFIPVGILLAITIWFGTNTNNKFWWYITGITAPILFIYSLINIIHDRKKRS